MDSHGRLTRTMHGSQRDSSGRYLLIIPEGRQESLLCPQFTRRLKTRAASAVEIPGIGRNVVTWPSHNWHQTPGRGQRKRICTGYG